VLTSDEVQELLVSKGWEDDFPLFTTINRIANGKIPPSAIVRYDEQGVGVGELEQRKSSRVKDRLQAYKKGGPTQGFFGEE